MKKSVLTFGIISGIIMSLMMVVMMAFMCGSQSNYEGSEIVGYSSMILSLSLVFFGIRSYRQNYNNGAITFGKAFQVGILIALIASLFYVATWMVMSYTYMSDFMDNYAKHYIEKLKVSGESQAAIDKGIKEMEHMKELYKNPLIRMGMTFLEIFPVGLLVTIISAAILRKKPVAV